MSTARTPTAIRGAILTALGTMSGSGLAASPQATHLDAAGLLELDRPVGRRVYVRWISATPRQYAGGPDPNVDLEYTGEVIVMEALRTDPLTAMDAVASVMQTVINLLLNAQLFTSSFNTSPLTIGTITPPQETAGVMVGRIGWRTVAQFARTGTTQYIGV